MCKGPVRTLLVAPKGTVKGEEDQEAAQWLKEYQTFDPDAKVFKVFSRKDYKSILKANNGTLPPGTYVTYDHAFFKTNAVEDIPRSWKDNRRGMTAEECFRTAMDIPKDQYAPPIGTYIGDGVSWECDGYVEGLGQTRNGIKCICLLYTSPSPRDATLSRMPSSA